MKLRKGLCGILTFCLVNSLNSVGFACDTNNKIWLGRGGLNISRTTCMQRVNNVISNYNLIVSSRNNTSVLTHTQDNEITIQFDCSGKNPFVDISMTVCGLKKISATIESDADTMMNYIENGKW